MSDTEGEQAPAESPATEQDSGTNWWVELRGLALMLLAVIGFHSLVAKPFYIPSISMMPNLLVGDRLVVSKYPYGWSWVSASFHVLPRSQTRILPRTPEYGDIVIVVPPNSDDDYIKRVVALPGDRISVVGGQIILNGKPVPQVSESPIDLPVDANQPCEPEEFPGLRFRAPDGKMYCELPVFRETLPNGATYRIIDHTAQPLDNYAQVTVPPGHVFLMGDNRDHSADSRAPIEEKGLGGPVPLSSVGGRAEFVTFSLDGSSSLNPLNWWNSLRPGRAWTRLRPMIAKPLPDPPSSVQAR
ncbi:signal peptidase I [Novosphingobium cyanobacteriorum]|uniref:Signal peptidase I n=1 Tax=Novosphingobium cyanobacteriorum TaxID=3024215 RepID=A0ABT6CF34_9SPHN|nr:signal peptidase I [Novosphingobium cyanobacteriorum]MDF8332516.1 signal peptidase I [Novosphingobium cyanobacteriorum]